MWGIVDPDQPREERNFCIVGTGQPIPALTDLDYIGTWQEGESVWHLFEDLGTNFGSVTQSMLRQTKARATA